MAKDASSNNDYISAEIFRQYAEHYRKIVTEINEKKNQNRQFNMTPQAETPQPEAPQSEAQMPENQEEQVAEAQAPQSTEKKSFTIVEIPHTEAQTVEESPIANDETPHKPKRVYRRRQTVAE